jgi:hypothetical protein
LAGGIGCSLATLDVGTLSFVPFGHCAVAGELCRCLIRAGGGAGDSGELLVGLARLLGRELLSSMGTLPPPASSCGDARRLFVLLDKLCTAELGARDPRTAPLSRHLSEVRMPLSVVGTATHAQAISACVSGACGQHPPCPRRAVMSKAARPAPPTALPPRPNAPAPARRPNAPAPAPRPRTIATKGEKCGLY